MGKEIKVVCLDLDDTLIKDRMWPKFSRAMGMTADEDVMLYNLHRNGNISYTTWVKMALSIYKSRNNLKRPEIEKIINNYCYYPFAKELVDYLKQKYIVVLLSGAIGLIVEKVANELGIKYFKSLTEFFFDTNGNITDIKVDDPSGDEAKNKVHFLEEICSQIGVKLENCVCIGDGDNDYQLFKRTRGITFHYAEGKHKILAWKIVQDLNEIKTIL